MKLLFDQNLSPRLALALADLFPGSRHVQDAGLACAPDDVLWEYARDHAYVIVTRDVDFSDRAVLSGHPPKIVWVRLGNCATARIEAALREGCEQVEAFGRDPAVSVLTLLG